MIHISKIHINLPMRGDNMAKYLISASYSSEGVKGLLADGGTKRKKVIEGLVNGLGGSVESFYYAFGSDDLHIIVDMPDNVAMTAIVLATTSTGAVANLTTTVLITPEEIDEAAQKTVDYTPPGA
jgi:uncharacterized protein with GYD domain